MLHALPRDPFDTDEIVPAVVSPHARVEFNANRYSVPPNLARQTVTIRPDGREVRILHQGKVMAQHARSYQRGQLIVLPDHRLAAIALSRQSRSSAPEQAFDSLDPEARQFNLSVSSRLSVRTARLSSASPPISDARTSWSKCCRSSNAYSPGTKLSTPPTCPDPAS